MSEKTKRSTMGTFAIALNGLSVLKWLAIVGAAFLVRDKESATFTMVMGGALVVFYAWVTYGLSQGLSSACDRAVRVHIVMAVLSGLGVMMVLGKPMALAMQIGSLVWHAGTAWVTNSARNDFRELPGGWKLND